MAKTNFNALTDEQKTVWSRDVWKLARNYSFVSKFAGKGPNAMIQRITELTKSEKGTRAVMTLVADLETDGVAGDDQLEGNEEAIKAFDLPVQVDQIRQANRHKGRLADQKSVVNFREQSRDVLAYWLSDRIDQLAFLTLSGVDYSKTTRGADRVGSAFQALEFAGDVTAPSDARHLRWTGTALAAGDTTAVANGATPSYKMLVEAKAYAKEHYIRGIKGPDGKEYYHVFMTPFGMSQLKLDSDYLANVRNAGVRGGSNELFKGADTVMVDGLLIHEFRHVYNTKGAASGSKWGAGGAIDGQRVLFCGAQAPGFVDLGAPLWIEKGFDYDNQQGISVAKMLGFKKPVWPAVIDDGDQDFGLLTIDTALNPA